MEDSEGASAGSDAVDRGEPARRELGERDERTGVGEPLFGIAASGSITGCLGETGETWLVALETVGVSLLAALMSSALSAPVVGVSTGAGSFGALGITF